MVKLYQLKSAWGVPCPSPFGLKLETYLKMANIPYEVCHDFNFRMAPKGKVPFIEYGGKLMGDSGLIIEYLKGIYGDPLDGRLNPSEKAVLLSMQRLIEENLYWVGLYSRWFEETNWKIVRETFFGRLPFPLKVLLPTILHKKIWRDIQGHGMGRHSREEIYRIGQRDLQAVSDFLADKPFMMGEKPTSLDATVFGFLVNILDIPLASPLKEYGLKLKNLKPYCQRMREKYYPADRKS